MNIDRIFESIKTYSKAYDAADDRELINIYSHVNDEYEIGCIINYLKEKDLYESYLFVVLGKELIASNLIPREISNEQEVTAYFEELKQIVNQKDLNLVLELCKKNNI